MQVCVVCIYGVWNKEDLLYKLPGENAKGVLKKLAFPNAFFHIILAS